MPEAERAAWQVLRADIRLKLARGFDEMADDLSETVNYAELSDAVKALAAERPRQLLETLAAELVALVLNADGVMEVEVMLKKRILPGTDFVAVRMHRIRESQA
ncbi:dihydroneopterin aldolase [Phragmitibacter flavus]|uniref:dihydroneopterin aldolase n=1 Tax=Phragmitibacter flavus TaxID=2576071 RepID=UPI003CCE42E7